MPTNNELPDYDARHARWKTMVGAWRCSYCPCTTHQRTVLNPTCQICHHIHLLPAADRVLPDRRQAPVAPGETTTPQLPLLSEKG